MECKRWQFIRARVNFELVRSAELNSRDGSKQSDEATMQSRVLTVHLKVLCIACITSKDSVKLSEKMAEMWGTGAWWQYKSACRLRC